MSGSLHDKTLEHFSAVEAHIVEALESLDPHGPKFVKKTTPPGEDVQMTTHHLRRTENRTVADPPFAPIENAAVTLVSSIHATPEGLPSDLGTFSALPPGKVFRTIHLSVTVHPRSPHAPAVQGSWTYYQTYANTARTDVAPDDWWFAGSSNLIPTYIKDEDTEDWHKLHKDAVSAHGEHVYKPLKEQADKRFHHSNRKESHGVGGIHFDQLSDKPHEKVDIHGHATKRPKSGDDIFALVASTIQAFIDGYIPILKRRAFQSWTPEERTWQLIQRGKFVEYFFLHEPDLKTNLAVGGEHTAAILAVLPETVQWVGATPDLHPESAEAKHLKALQAPKTSA
ncbi:coproporphyrinogen III oxidase [Ceratobasidium sp. AG-Ba]|nr:coproporphyrinogen III oxidase [Ceratobasidium sp. AG-Ba]QRW07683.1 coproporphyrinogen III oxidase [Ceratobasidium sp. AG-Ba]